MRVSLLYDSVLFHLVWLILEHRELNHMLFQIGFSTISPVWLMLEHRELNHILFQIGFNIISPVWLLLEDREPSNMI
eukprot:UN06292